jgi:hypothetical protein
MTDRNPLTGLPGNSSIRKVLKERVLGGDHTAVYVDIISFKPFNDHYGFALGDSVIRRLALILTESLRGSFVGHIGGDDFICAGHGEDFITAVEGARQRFRSMVPGFYSRRDREQGGIETFDRRGSYRFFPMLDVSVVTAGGGDFGGTIEELAAAAGREKKRLKGEMFPEPVHPVLERALDRAFPVTDLKALVEACGVLREEKAVPVLCRVLEGEYGWNLRKSAALALGHIGNERCGEMLLGALKDTNPHVRTRAVEGLVLARGSAAGPVIHRLLGDGSTWVRRAVLRGMGRAGWMDGAESLRKACTARAPGREINTVEERRAALEGISLLGSQAHAPFLHSLCKDRSYFPLEAAFSALCSLGTDHAADVIFTGGGELPPVLNLFGMGEDNLRRLEGLARNALSMGEPRAGYAIRFFEGFPGELSGPSVSCLRNCLGEFYGELFRRLVLFLGSRNIKADPSCVARVSNRVEKGQRIGDDGLCAFLGWVSENGGVNPGALLSPFLRTSRRPVAASAAVAAAALAERGLDAKDNPVNNSVNRHQPKGTP